MAAAKKNTAAEPEIGPAPLRAEDVRSAAASQPRVLQFMDRMAADPPQVILLEGGSSRQRLYLSRFFAARINCRQEGPPCLSCPTCLQTLSGAHRDLFELSGEGKTIKIDEVRELRPILGEPPRNDGMRVLVLAEAQGLTTESSNGLLKSLEEPRPGNVFLLLAPQRERLLPTLVSRSWVLTLSWPDPLRREADATLQQWLMAMEEFIMTGRGWFAKTSGKGAVDRQLALAIVIELRRELTRAMVRNPGQGLASALARGLDADRKARLDVALHECEAALGGFVNPATVLDWLATRIHAWMR